MVNGMANSKKYQHAKVREKIVFFRESFFRKISLFSYIFPCSIILLLIYFFKIKI